eukprot:CAMPEP_0194365870 /NCGR_PEP_ID=MMETSP0174-20130528/13846_1 /TAXON_ID=216777 /ORGANISM="Proboscia alata, Strain PI-D3" /LENGTH=522 /DNA_ID=CAMNT_0039140721 /DNA_START=99 /DNA_END=1667 /DNA_ORIENTATION=-
MVFAATAFLFLLTNQKRKKKNDFTYDDEDIFSPDGAALAIRGIRALKPPLPYWAGFLKCLSNPCDPTMNPEGYIALCMAENKLVQESFARRLMQPATAINAFSDSVVYGYNSFLGLPSAREAAAYFLARRFLRARDGGHSSMYGSDLGGIMKPNSSSEADENSPPTSTPFIDRIDPEHVALSSGAAAVLNSLFFSLANPGEAVLIPAPYYAAFENDMIVVAGLVPFPVHSENPIAGPTPKDLEIAKRKAEKEGLTVKILLITNPNNPLAVVHSPQVMRAAVHWAKGNKIHTIVDEIYALSLHKKDNNCFESIIKILHNNLGNDVHCVWAFSKDLAASGFRIGLLYTQNIKLMQALSTLNIFSGVSHPMQMVASEILLDDFFLDSFLEESRVMLVQSYQICAEKLDEMVIPYIPVEAAMFVYADFSALIPSHDFEGEAKFTQLVTEYARIVMTPGHTQRDCKPGMFRICYAWVTPDVLSVAMERLSILVTKVRKMDWDDINEKSMRDVLKVGSSGYNNLSLNF